MTCTIKEKETRPQIHAKSVKQGEVVRIANYYLMRIGIFDHHISNGLGEFINAHQIFINADDEDKDIMEFIPFVNLKNGNVDYIYEETPVDEEFSAHLELTRLE